MDYNGDFIASDGLVLEGFDSTGVPFGDPVILYPTHGELFDLSIAASKVILPDHLLILELLQAKLFCPIFF